MIVSARHATADDIVTLVSLYRGLEAEMTGLHSMWPLADGLPGDPTEAFRSALAAEDVLVIVGEIDGYPFGFIMAKVESLLSQAGGERLGSIRLVYVDPEAREVGLGEEMRDFVIADLRSRGISKFDAHVLPGHRLAKNFFEAGGFSARSIIMHHDDAG